MGRDGTIDLASNAKDNEVVAAEGTMNSGGSVPFVMSGTLSFTSYTYFFLVYGMEIFYY